MKTSVTKKYRFSAGSLSLTFLRTEEGLSLGGIADSDAGTVFFSGRSPLFSLKICIKKEFFTYGNYTD